MSYAKPSDVATRIGPAILLQLSAESGALVRDDAVIQSWLDAASETINGWIGTRYITPVVKATAPAERYSQLANWEADIAAYNAYAYRGTDDSLNPWKARHDSIVSKNEGILMRVASGLMNLVGIPEQSGKNLAPTGPRAGFTSERPHFTPPPLYGGDYR